MFDFKKENTCKIWEFCSTVFISTDFCRLKVWNIYLQNRNYILKVVTDAMTSCWAQTCHWNSPKCILIQTVKYIIWKIKTQVDEFSVSCGLMESEDRSPPPSDGEHPPLHRSRAAQQLLCSGEESSPQGGEDSAEHGIPSPCTQTLFKPPSFPQPGDHAA